MPTTVKAKYLLGWMSQFEAVEALNSCIFDPPLTKKKAIAIWRDYRDKVDALEPRDPVAPPSQVLTAEEQQAADAHLAQIRGGRNARFPAEVIKIDPHDLVARQLFVVTERSEQYAQKMQNEEDRNKILFGVGLNYMGQLPERIINPRLRIVDLPHDEFTPVIQPGGRVAWIERDRYVLCIRGGNRMVLWGGYHRTYAVMRHGAVDARGVEAGPSGLFTVMTGVPEVEDFLAGRALLAVRNRALGPRPALLRDFLDDDLCISVNLRAKRCEGRIEPVRNNKTRVRVIKVNVD